MATCLPPLPPPNPSLEVVRVFGLTPEGANDSPSDEDDEDAVAGARSWSVSSAGDSEKDIGGDVEEGVGQSDRTDCHHSCCAILGLLLGALPGMVGSCSMQHEWT